MRQQGDKAIGFFIDVNRVFGEENETSTEGKEYEKNEAKTLAFNALDMQHKALAKLEYAIMGHLSYLKDITKDLGDLESEVHGYQLIHFEILNQLKDGLKS